VGCCMGDSVKTNAMCNSRVTLAQCERSSSCNFVEGGILEEGDCDFGTTQPPDEPGCCYGNPNIAYSKRWMEQCKEYGTERECLMLLNEDGEPRCTFEPMNEYMDCEAVWPTTTSTPTEEPGCCRGDSYKSNDKCRRNDNDQAKCEKQGCEFVTTYDFSVCEISTTETPTTTSEVGCCKADAKKREDMCLARDTEAKCLKSASCVEWISGPNADCSFEETTTDEPGCCYINPGQAYSKKYQDTCITFGTERECLKLTDSDGKPRCVFEPMNEYGDCSMLWPTTTSSPTEPVGCCYGDSYKQNDRCSKATTQSRCEDMGCSFLITDDPDDCIMTTTETPTTTATPGCCKGTSRTSNDACNAIGDAGQCDRRSSCTFIAFGILAVDCVFPPTEPPSEPGCCYGNPDIAYSKRWMEECKKFGTEEECLMLTNDDGEPRCFFEPLGEYEDCETVWPTTTTTTIAPGCCKGTSYKQNDKCRGFDNDQAQCERKGCEFVVTDDFSDCDITTTETPTTTVTPGCCKGTSRTSNDACNAIEDPDQCDRRSSCTFIAFGILEEDCVFPPTEPPSEPGCCYGNPDIAYSKRWMEQCKKFGTEEECLMLTNDDGEPRCYFEPLGEYEDCETVWPTTTTTTEEIGCCYADSYKANDKCGRATDRARCEDMGCFFLVTDDPSDCELTTTSTPTTTSEAGCCYGEGVKENEMCGNKIGRDQCERSDKCEFREGEDADCEFVPTTTTSEPWLEAKDEEYALPFNPYKQAKKSARKGASHRQEEAMLFGGDNVVGQAMQYQVSLSSVLMMVIAAFAVYQVYRWMSARKNKDYEAVQTRPVQYYQSA